MTPFVAYDVTRLLARYAVPSPNGIDRVDLAYARYFLAAGGGAAAGVFMHGLEPARLDMGMLAGLLADIERNWRVGPVDGQTAYDRVRNFLLGRGAAVTAAPRRPVPAHRYAPLRLLRPRLLARALLDRIPADAVFIHTTHYPQAHLFRWLKRRPDVKPVFFIHDLLPLQFPEYFAPAHIAEHRRSLEIFARYGRAAIVNTRTVEDEVARFLDSRGRRDVRVLARPIPADPVFAAPADPDPALSDIPYFVVCGTIEPRKNHLLLLQMWRALARRHGDRTPKLVVIGRRGWENENVVDLFDRSHELRPHVIEIAGLPTAAVARLTAGARALLMPSFAEGYGLPVVEARAVGTPVIASDIPVFREVAPDATFRGPIDGLGWLQAVETHAERSPDRPRPAAAEITLDDYFSAVEAFIASL